MNDLVKVRWLTGQEIIDNFKVEGFELLEAVKANELTPREKKTGKNFVDVETLPIQSLKRFLIRRGEGHSLNTSTEDEIKKLAKLEITELWTETRKYLLYKGNIVRVFTDQSIREFFYKADEVVVFLKRLEAPCHTLDFFIETIRQTANAKILNGRMRPPLSEAEIIAQAKSAFNSQRSESEHGIILQVPPVLSMPPSPDPEEFEDDDSVSTEKVKSKLQSIRGKKGGEKPKKNKPILMALKKFLENNPTLTAKTNDQIAKKFQNKVKGEKSINVNFNNCKWDVYFNENRIWAIPDIKTKNKVKSISCATFRNNYISEVKKSIKPTRTT